MQQAFFNMAEAERRRLPKGSPQEDAEAFLAVNISIICAKRSNTYAVKAIKALHTFLRYDSAVFQVFRPSKPLIRKMDLEKHIMSQSAAEVEAALDLA